MGDDRVVQRLRGNLAAYAAKNSRQWAYYDGKAGVKNMGIAIPEALLDVEAVIGWPEIIVDALAERIEWLGWRSSDDISGLEAVFAQNQLDVEVSKAVLDSLVTGVGFLAVTEGGDGEPEVLVNAVPSSQATYVWDDRLNRVAAGLVVARGDGGETVETLYLPDSTVVRVDGEVHRVTEHGRGRCGLVVLPNRARAGAMRGRSEITRTIRYYTDHGVRTILGMEYNREFYTTPQRYLVGVVPEQLGLDDAPSQSDVARVGWQMAQNKALIVPPGDPEDGKEQPRVGQFQAASPAPYIDELKMLSQLVSAQSGVPASYLGFVSDNPTSADAIRAAEARLVKRAEMRQASFGQVLRNDLAVVVQSILSAGQVGAGFVSGLSLLWREASTPTLAATMDAMVKAVQVGIFPPGSEYVWDQLGVPESGRMLMRRELASQRAHERLTAMEKEAREGAPAPVDGSVGFDGFVSGSDSSGL